MLSDLGTVPIRQYTVIVKWQMYRKDLDPAGSEIKWPPLSGTVPSSGLRISIRNNIYGSTTLLGLQYNLYRQGQTGIDSTVGQLNSLKHSSGEPVWRIRIPDPHLFAFFCRSWILLLGTYARKTYDVYFLV
jgi:hypothetical protein